MNDEMNDETSDEAKTIAELRLACRQFAMLYFHFCKTLVESLGEEQALPLVQKALFELSLDRSDGARERARDRGLAATLENFPQVNDLPSAAWEKWDPRCGELRCPYAQQWVGRFKDYPWFKKLASLYCDVIDTTNIENFSRTTSHRITKNLLWGDPVCEREYFESDPVKQGNFSYGKR
ncbi:MAG: L-2-amino-thiazoline-4-carboxylic acid hydrolase [Treponema sp.]|jgi:hypothetical protein|nr:L-2-amino-thiazoline-4-carboxylic acid hydrolase [Treponema sp.]